MAAPQFVNVTETPEGKKVELATGASVVLFPTGPETYKTDLSEVSRQLSGNQKLVELVSNGLGAVYAGYDMKRVNQAMSRDYQKNLASYEPPRPPLRRQSS